MSQTSERYVAVVTGAGRGLGFATAQALAEKDYHVILVVRKGPLLKKAVDALQKKGLSAEGFRADVSNPTEVKKLVAMIKKRHKRVDVLVNNAGIMIDPPEHVKAGASSIFKAKISTILKTMETNTFAPLELAQQLVPLMKQHGFGRIVNVSSGMGGLTEMEGRYPAYRISKTALNAVTRILSAELQGTNIKVNSVCPGWVKTDMGGSNAERTIEQGISGIVWAATLEDDGPSGGFFRDGQPIAW